MAAAAWLAADRSERSKEVPSRYERSYLGDGCVRILYYLLYYAPLIQSCIVFVKIRLTVHCYLRLSRPPHHVRRAIEVRFRGAPHGGARTHTSALMTHVRCHRPARRPSPQAGWMGHDAVGARRGLRGVRWRGLVWSMSAVGCQGLWGWLPPRYCDF